VQPALQNAFADCDMEQPSAKIVSNPDDIGPAESLPVLDRTG